MKGFSWIFEKGPQTVLEVLQKNGEARFVGGAVRNTFLEKPLADFDVATTHRPEETMTLLKEHGFPVIPTGLSHGTVTTLIEGVPYEITTLREDKETDGRHAVVQYTMSWQEDASRRDFTMNALYVDREGRLYDFFEGAEDIRQGRVRFIGQPEQRIAEDYLRILRFFRMHAYYGKGSLDEEGLLACQKMAPGMVLLSKERVTKEWVRLLKAPSPWSVLRELYECHFLKDLLKVDVYPSFFSHILETIEKHDHYIICPWTRLVLMIGPEGFSQLCSFFRLSNKEEAYCRQLLTPILLKEPVLLESLSEEGPLVTLKRMVVSGIFSTYSDWAYWKDWVDRFVFKPYPLTGQMLLDQGVQGVLIGKLLILTKEWWFQEGRTADAQGCLSYALSHLPYFEP